MRKTILLLLSAFISLTTCKKGAEQQVGDPDNDSPCAPMVCTLNFASVTVKYLDKNGQPLVVTNYKSVNKRTGLEIKNTGASNVTYNPGIYVVAHDGSLKEIAGTGDDILVTATNPSTSQTKTVTIRLAGGCACHIGKISGPAEVVFD